MGENFIAYKPKAIKLIKPKNPRNFRCRGFYLN